MKKFLLKKQIAIWTLMLLTLIASALADWQDQDRCQVSTACNIERTLVDSLLAPLSGASCNITISNTTTLLISAAPMTDLGTGIYNYTFRPNATGTYPSRMFCSALNQTSVQDLTFTAAKKEAWSQVFELAIPAVFLAIAFSCLAGYFAFKPDRQTLSTVTVRNSLLALTFVFILVSIIAIKHIIDYENDVGNATLTALSNLTQTIYVGSLWATVGIIMWIGVVLVMQGADLIRKQATEKRGRDEQLFEQPETGSDGGDRSWQDE